MSTASLTMLPKRFKASDRIHLCVLLAPPPVQLLDLAPVDVFHMLSQTYIGALSLLPQAVKSLAIAEVKITYVFDDGLFNDAPELDIHRSSAGKQSVHADLTANLTANLKIQAQPLSTAAGVQPGQISILFIPGPDPTSTPSTDCKNFISAHASSGKTDIVTVCTGIYPVCHAGICDGRIVTGPRGLLPELRSRFKNATFEDKRWSKSVLDQLDAVPGKNSKPLRASCRRAELWTAAGITNGHDTVAAYVKEHFDPELAAIVCRMCDIGDRQQDYETGKVADTAWWLSRILTVVVKQLFGRA